MTTRTFLKSLAALCLMPLGVAKAKYIYCAGKRNSSKMAGIISARIEAGQIKLLAEVYPWIGENPEIYLGMYEFEKWLLKSQEKRGIEQTPFDYSFAPNIHPTTILIYLREGSEEVPRTRFVWMQYDRVLLQLAKEKRFDILDSMMFS